MTTKLKFNIQKDLARNELLSFFGKSVLKDRYLLPNEDYQDLFARVASFYAKDETHAQRLYDYMSKLWFMPATPVLSNGGTNRGLPISCFLNESEDSLDSIAATWMENVWLASKGGGIGTYWGKVRSIKEKIAQNGESSGIIPFLKVQDSMTLAISQGSLRRGSSAAYLDISHPEIEEFIDLRRPTGGDPNRRCLNIHHGVVITDDFMEAVMKNENWNLVSPHDGKILNTVKARDLWMKLLAARVENGEPYILFIDHVNKLAPKHHQKLGLKVKTSNLCSEITLPTGQDHLNNTRTAVCCLSSLNLEYFDEWQDNKEFIYDVMLFLDNVLEDFIARAPKEMANAKYSAMRERSIGLGVMGFHSFLQSKLVPLESAPAKAWNNKIFKHINTLAEQASMQLGEELGPCPDAIDAGSKQRFSNTTAIAPTASISVIAGNSSPGIEPYAANSFTQKTLSGSFTVKNKNLEKLLTAKGFNNEQIWSSISTHEGSVQHLDFLSDLEKMIYKTAYELDQNWLIQLAADRTPYISQAQSLNLFAAGNVEKNTLNKMHIAAWRLGVKSLYYFRSTSIQQAEKVSHVAKSLKEEVKEDQSDDQECLACQ